MPCERLRGVVLVAASAVAYSTAGFYTRLIPLDLWTILFWHGLFAGAFIAAWVVVREGRRRAAVVRAMGRPRLAVAACSGIATILFINAFRRTSVAQVVIILATLPVVTAAIGRVAFGIRESRATLAASELALFGITQFGLGLLLLTLGTRLVSATESALIGTLEVPLAALWVWLAFAATPQWSTLAGGAVMIAAVVWHVWQDRVTVAAAPIASAVPASPETG